MQVMVAERGQGDAGAAGSKERSQSDAGPAHSKERSQSDAGAGRSKERSQSVAGAIALQALLGGGQAFRLQLLFHGLNVFVDGSFYAAHHERAQG